MAAATPSGSRRLEAVVALWLILLLLAGNGNGHTQAAAVKTATVAVSSTETATQQLQLTFMSTAKQQYATEQATAATTTIAATTTPIAKTTTAATTTAAVTTATATTPTTAASAVLAAVNVSSNLSKQPRSHTELPIAASHLPTTTATTLTPINSSSSGSSIQLTAQETVVQLLDLEQTKAPPISNGHDGRKITKKKQLQEQHFDIAAAITTTRSATVAATTTVTTVTPTTTTSTDTTTTITATTTHIATTTTTTPTAATTTATAATAASSSLLPVPNGYLGPIFMAEKTFSVVHPLKKPQAHSHQQQQPLADSIESQLREGRIVEILAPTALLESTVESSSTRPSGAAATTTTTTTLPAAVHAQTVLSTTVFQVPELQTSTTRLPLAAAEVSVAGSAVLSVPPRTESKISDIQIEVYDSTVDSIVASTNFRDNQGFYPMPLEPAVGTTRPPLPSSPVAQERFTQYVIDRADVSTQPAADGLGKPEPAAIEIHINVSEAFGNESEDLEFSYRQPSLGETKSNKPNDEILVVEIIDSSAADNSTENSATFNAERLNSNPMYYPYRSDAAGAQPPAVRPPQPQDADDLFMADTKDGLPRPPHPPPPPPMPRKPNIDRDSDTIFYISNTEVKVGESLPTASSGSAEQQRKLQLESQFFPANYIMDQQRIAATPRYEEDIILSPLRNTADALKILRSPNGAGGSDGAPPLDVTYVGESVIEVEQQAVPIGASSTMQSTVGAQQDIIIQPAVLPDLAIGVPVIGELPPQIELKEIDYMPGELLGQPQGIYENDIDSNGIGQDLGMHNDPDVLESSIQYGGDLIDDGAGGGFDGVEGSYPFDSPAHRLQQQDAPQGHSHQLPHHGYSHQQREQLHGAELLNATLQQHNESAGGSEQGSASAMAPLLHGGNQLPERIGNATALSEDPMADYDGFLNLFAVSMGLIIVILPAALLTSMYCAVRYLLNKNATSNAAGDDSEQGQGQDYKHESSSSSVASSTSTLQQQQKASQNSNATLIRSMSLALASGVQRIEFQFEARAGSATATNTPTPEQPFNTLTEAFVVPFSGSVTKMTLKDNHLIVVTEERHDISRNARETKMHTDKDGVFVVEVARGIDSKQLPESPAAVADFTELPFDTNTKLSALGERSLPPSHEQVQIHAPPSDFANTLPAGTANAANGLQLIEEEQLPEEDALVDQQAVGEPIQSQTGLSQSDLSSASSSDSNKRYSYGNQELYVIEQPGYAGSSPLLLNSKPIPSEATTENDHEMQSKPNLEQKRERQQLEVEEPPVPAPAEFGNANGETGVEPGMEMQMKTAVETDSAEEKQEEEHPKGLDIQIQLTTESENNYDSLMSLPAPPSTEEIKELNDFTLIESNQLDSLPPPPPPPPLAEAQNGADHSKHSENPKPDPDPEPELEPEPEPEPNQPQEAVNQIEDHQIKCEPKLILGNGNLSKLCPADAPNSTLPPPPAVATVATTAVAVNGKGEEPSTLTPPASPPASPSAGSVSLCGGSLSNGIHGVNQPVAVDVNGS